METALGWIGQIASALLQMIPRFVHIETQNCAAIVTRGNRVRELKPGMHLFWPFWSTVWECPRVTQTVNLPAQAVLSQDGINLVISGMVRYNITDAVTALVSTYDLDNVIVDEALAILCQYVSEHSVDKIQSSRHETNQAITILTRRRLQQYGVYAQRCQLTDFSRCVTLNHLGLPRLVASAAASSSVEQ